MLFDCLFFFCQRADELDGGNGASDVGVAETVDEASTLFFSRSIKVETSAGDFRVVQ